MNKGTPPLPSTHPSPRWCYRPPVNISVPYLGTKLQVYPLDISDQQPRRVRGRQVVSGRGAQADRASLPRASAPYTAATASAGQRRES